MTSHPACIFQISLTTNSESTWPGLRSAQGQDRLAVTEILISDMTVSIIEQR